MKLKKPFQISARLLPALHIGGAWVQLERLPGLNSENRTVYRWTIDLPDGAEFTGSDLRSGCGGGSLQSGFESLLSFLGAFAEAGEDRENSDLFPAGLREWAESAADEIAVTACDLDESLQPLICD